MLDGLILFCVGFWLHCCVRYLKDDCKDDGTIIDPISNILKIYKFQNEVGIDKKY